MGITMFFLRLLDQVIADPSEFLSNADKITILQKLVANPLIRVQAALFVRANAADLITRLTSRSVISFIGALANFAGTTTDLDNVSSPEYYYQHLRNSYFTKFLIS